MKNSPEHRRKISLSKIGKPSPNKGKKFWRIVKELLTTSERRRFLSKRWKNENHDKNLFINSRYRARRKNAEGCHTLGEWERLKAQYNWTCPACGKSEPEIRLSEDHIVSLSRGGSDNIENIQPLCRICNSRKNTKIIFYGG